MTGNSTYAKMMMPFPVRVWRYRLHPLSVNHYTLLCRIDHPLIEGDKVLEPGELAMALWILSRSGDQAEAKMGGWSCLRFVRKLGRKFLKNTDLHLRVLNDFYRYWAWNNESYEIWKTDDSGGSPKSMSWLQTIKWVLMHDWGFSHSEIMKMPYKLAVNDALGGMVAHGKIDFVSDAHRARREYVQRMKKEEEVNG